MATVTIRSGGSDNELLVNNDGSINARSTPISGPVDTVAQGFSSLSVTGQATVNLVSIELFPANPNRRYAHIVNNSGNVIYIQYSAPALLNAGIKIPPNTLYTIETNNLWLGSVNAIGVINGQVIDILEGEQ